MILLRDAGSASSSRVLSNVRLISPSSGDTSEPTTLTVTGGKIAAIGEAPPPGVPTHECSGAFVIPGLCDAHCHPTACSAGLSSLLGLSEALVTARAVPVLESMLLRGFTTIRDCGGADWGLAQAVEEGAVAGPRILFTGHALSQTGGHGDMRAKGEDCFACGAALRGLGRVCDGDTEVRRAARDELRKGAHCIKVMASGGVSSPTDRLEHTQFSMGELRAIVEEAEAHNTYVCAHAYTDRAIRRCVEAGVRSIEHGNYIEPDTAALLAKQKGFLVPTIITYSKLATDGAKAGMPQEQVAKVGDLVEAGLRSLKIAKEAGVTICYGSDLLGDLHCFQGEEFGLRRKQLTNLEVLRSATVNCARLFNRPDLGDIKVGATADLLILRKDPLRDISVLQNPDNFVYLLKEGRLVGMHRAFVRRPSS